MITVSTSNAQVRAYHHGDLRAALVEAGLTALVDTPANDLSLRQLARDVGVSATAVYRHFADKQALLRALAAEGLERLGRFQQAAAAPEQTVSGNFAAIGRAYVRFALANPALFRLTFSEAPAGEAIFGDTLAARLLHEDAALSAGGSRARTEQLMIQAWAVVHGLAMLMLDGQLPQDHAMIDRIIDPATLFGGHGSSSDESP